MGEADLVNDLVDVIIKEADALKALVSAPLPDTSFLDVYSHQPCKKLSITEIEPTLAKELTELRNEIRATLEEEASQSKWSLGMHHTLNESIPDIRKLNPDAKISDDADGNKASLYWYEKCKSVVDPNCDLTQDTIYNDLVNRVVFGYSLDSKRKQEDDNADVQSTRLAHQMFKVIEAANVLERHQLNQQKEDEASSSRKPSVATQREQCGAAPDADRGMVFSRSAQTDVIPVSMLDNKAQTHPRRNCGSTYSTIEINQVEFPLQKHSQCNAAITSFHTSTTPNVETPSNSIDESRQCSPFIEGLLAKMKDVDKGYISLDEISSNKPMPCRRVREILYPLVSGFVEAGKAIEIDASDLVDLIEIHIKSTSKTITCESFVKAVVTIALSLSECMLETMGGKDAVVQASNLIFKYFCANDDLLVNELSIFLREVSTSARSRNSALFIGRLLDRMGKKENKSGLQVVKAFVQSFQKDDYVPLASFLKWLASLKPKFSATEMDDLLSDLSNSQDATQVSMTRFIQFCLPAQTSSSKDLTQKLASSTCIKQMIEVCKEKDSEESGLIQWRVFLEVNSIIDYKIILKLLWPTYFIIYFHLCWNRFWTTCQCH